MQVGVAVVGGPALVLAVHAGRKRGLVHRGQPVDGGAGRIAALPQAAAVGDGRRLLVALVHSLRRGAWVVVVGADNLAQLACRDADAVYALDFALFAGFRRS